MSAVVRNTTFFEVDSDADLSDAKLDAMLAAEPERVQVELARAKISVRGWRALDARLLARRPSVVLRVYGSAKIDASFLSRLEHLQRLSIETKRLDGCAVLARLPRLSHLHLSVDTYDEPLRFLKALASTLTELRLTPESSPRLALDLAALLELPKLRTLQLHGHGDKLADLIPKLPALEELSLVSTGPVKGELAFVLSCPRLDKLHLGACGVTDYGALADLSQLRALSLYKPAKLRTLDVLAGMSGLQWLSLHTANLPKAMPSLRSLSLLRRVVLNALAALRDFSALANTTTVKELAFYDIRAQMPADFLPVLMNRAIERVYLWSLKPTYRKVLEATLAGCGRTSEKINVLDDLDFAYR